MHKRPIGTGESRSLLGASRDKSWRAWLRAGQEVAVTHRQQLLGVALLALLLLLVLRLARTVIARRWSTFDLTDSSTSPPPSANHPPPPSKAPTPSEKQSVERRKRPATGGNSLASTERSTKQKERAQSRWWQKAEGWLLFFEVGAVLFVLATGAGAWVTLQDLNETYRTLHQAGPQVLPTLGAAANPVLLAAQDAPLALVQERRRLLPPAGAMAAPPLPTPPPTVTPASPATPAAGGAIPAPAPTQALDYAQRIQIPVIDVDSPVYQSNDPRALKLGVAQFGYPTAPGQPGNLVLAGHNDSYGEIFRHLEQLEKGDEVTLSGNWSTHRYRVRDKLIVKPDEIWVTLPTSSATLTLITCHPYLIDTHRLVVFADLAE